ncbi:MAG: GNAT family N-acetyltransferase [Myxococcota bacterium]
MAFAVLYHYRLRSGCRDAYTAAWSRLTRLIRRQCGSYGSRLHFAGDHAWAYARWPSAEARAVCFARADLQNEPSLAETRACVAEKFDEIVLEIVDDQLAEPRATHPPVTLTTTRLLLRPLVIDDATALHPAMSDPEVMRYWSHAAHASFEASLDLIRRNVGQCDSQAVAMTRPSAPDDALGWVVLVDRGPEVVELGCFLRPDAERHGYAREAAAAIVEHAFTARRCRRVYGDTDPENTRSIRLLERLGFVREGHLRATWSTHLGIRDSVIYGRLATDPPPKSS